MNKIVGIIITGTSGAGKTSLALKLQEINSKFDFIKALTTRNKREDDNNHYIYLTSEEFDQKKDSFFISTSYRKDNYAYSYDEIKKSVDSLHLPILVVSPKSISGTKTSKEKPETEEYKNLGRYMTFFIDSSDDELDKRLEKRDGEVDHEAESKRREEDRSYSDIPDYIIQNHNLLEAANLINRLLELHEISTELSEEDIGLYIQSGLLVNNADVNNIKGASYDLGLGDEYYYRGEIKKLKDQHLRLTIAPYDYVLVSSKEEISLPKDVVAHFGLTVGLFCQGIILSNGQQVDPGFRGKLFCLLFNTSNQPVTIKKGAHYATIEFTKMNKLASKYKGKYQGKRDIIDVLPFNAMQGGLSELQREIEELKNESKNMQSIYISVIAIVFAAISILLIIK